jgi:hypothetical protein
MYVHPGPSGLLAMANPSGTTGRGRYQHHSHERPFVRNRGTTECVYDQWCVEHADVNLEPGASIRCHSLRVGMSRGGSPCSSA